MTDDRFNISRAAFDFVDDIERMSDRHQVMDRFTRELSQHGFHAWLITGLPNPGNRIDPLMMLNGWPAGWSELYTERDFFRHDPVAAHCYRSTVPFEWHEVPYDPQTNPIAQEVMERATDYGMNRGYCVPIHSSGGYQAAVTIAGNQVELGSQVKRALHLMALYAHGKATELCRTNILSPERKLTRREREVLQWTAAGKSSWEISRI